jgi:hypothetical protein
MFGIVYEISFDFINLKLGISVFYLKKKFLPAKGICVQLYTSHWTYKRQQTDNSLRVSHMMEDMFPRETPTSQVDHFRN